MSTPIVPNISHNGGISTPILKIMKKGVITGIKDSIVVVVDCGLAIT